ncbi:MAG: 6-phosphogluconolactonase [Nocardioidaceae bacterium]|nr:6-phosphogluconolactonase [Nocardioidaceae bacterium]
MREVRVLADAEVLAAEVAETFLDLVRRHQAAGTAPHVALTGGTIAERVHAAIAAHPRAADVDWTQVVFWWGDERFVPAESEDRNALHARRVFLDVVGATQVHEMPASDGGRGLDEAAAAYGQEIRTDKSADEFDLVMLGIGPDGHVASLFPGHPQLDVDDIAVGVPDSPKPPPQRITLTFGALNRTSEVWFLASGDSKSEAVARALAEEGTVHATPARGITANQIWFLDDESASGL